MYRLMKGRNFPHLSWKVNKSSLILCLGTFKMHICNYFQIFFSKNALFTLLWMYLIFLLFVIVCFGFPCSCITRSSAFAMHQYCFWLNVLGFPLTTRKVKYSVFCWLVFPKTDAPLGGDRRLSDFEIDCCAGKHSTREAGSPTAGLWDSRWIRRTGRKVSCGSDTHPDGSSKGQNFWNCSGLSGYQHGRRALTVKGRLV